MFIVRHRIIFFIISGLLFAGSFFAFFTKGLNFGIDFKGGSIVEVEYSAGRPDVSVLKDAIDPLGFSPRIQETGDNGFLIRTRTLDDAKGEHTALLSALTLGGTVEATEVRYNSIGPVIGKELRDKAWLAILAVIVGIVLFIAFVFRKVSEPVSSWKYGVITSVALLHDIIIPTGVFAFLGKEIDTLFVVGLLSIMGLSVHDTIVVFDRVRENLKLKISSNFSETVGASLRQTFTRSINTSLTIIFVLIALYFVGPASTHDFALLLLIGMTIGTYSSVFIASPLLVVAEESGKK
ncbi:MAG: protein-export membrane protein SecF [Candidatus Yonathbacteria bacterium RIFCSPHIGHO2_01_FULL_51_10]|uniref:Protein-export membrane protein SecF n=1 Tax=Candidatus Yonathbacteria bacterium RIFCSPHIGHO2_01_FULL_51_10 TaxID=1802723 RepID=A0A1G2S5Z6_9BACT|nr:MAG: protein-export membrane protein SecF [Candidatus Yonathbacteria bacterium RIFCSPHIGHO2_01_FULL_51_10]